MIPNIYIDQWRVEAPWLEQTMTEQDLIISQILVLLFSNSKLNTALAFRGGTALHKLFIRPALRYSEDIDLVQIKPEPIGSILETIKEILNPIFGKPKWKLGEGRATLWYKYQPEDTLTTAAKLKIEINTREHFAYYGFKKKPFSVKSGWFTGDTQITTYSLNELIATKLRALYQRKKGRDLFDLWVVLGSPELNIDKVIKAFTHYLDFEKKKIPRSTFEENFEAKLTLPVFLDDIKPLLPPNSKFNMKDAAQLVKNKILNYLP